MNRHRGSDFFELFEETGERVAVEVGAMKKAIVHDLRGLMKAQGVTQAELARRMNTSRAVVHRLLDEANHGVTVATLAEAAIALRATVSLRLHAMPARAEKPVEVPAPTAATSPKPRAGKSPPRGERAAPTAKRRAAKRRGAA